MANPPTPKPQWATLGIIGVVLGILGGAAFVAGPTATDCANQTGSFGACLQQGLTERGIIPPTDKTQETVEVAVAKPADSAEPTSLGVVATPPAPEAIDHAETAESISKLIFDVRVEPDGSTLVIGNGAPSDSEVQIFADGALLGQTRAEKSGDWVFIPNAPLPTGGVEITAATADGTELSDQSLVVIVNEDLNSEPIVVASVPGEASRIIQGDTASAVVAKDNADPAPVRVGDKEPKAELEVSPVEPVARSAEMAGGGDPESVIQETEAQGAAAQGNAPAAKDEPAIDEKSIEVAVADPSVQMPKDGAKAVPTLKPTVAPSTQLVVTTPPTIDAIEIDGNRNFFAGGGQDGSVVRLYVQDRYVADATIAGGRWLVETNEQLLTDQSQRVRVDMLQTGSSTVIARAEVNFEIAPIAPAVVSKEAAPVAVARADQPEAAAAAPVTETAPVVDVSTAINAAASQNESGKLMAPPALPVTTPATDVEAPIETAMAKSEPINATPKNRIAPEPTEAETKTVNTPKQDQPSVEVPVTAPADNENQSAPPSVVAEKPAPSPAVKTDPNDAINAVAAANAPSQLATPPSLPNSAPKAIEKPLEVAKVETKSQISPARESETTAPQESQPEVMSTLKPQQMTKAETADADTPAREAQSGTGEPKIIAAAPRNAPPAAVETMQKGEPESSPIAAVSPTVTPQPKAVVPEAQQTSELDAVQPEDAKPEIPTLIARPTADGRFVSGQAIIRRGDNLWTIARRVYGQGIRYTTIYQANQSQIRNPNLIYPGQVFDLPEGQQ